MKKSDNKSKNFAISIEHFFLSIHLCADIILGIGLSSQISKVWTEVMKELSTKAMLVTEQREVANILIPLKTWIGNFIVGGALSTSIYKVA